MAYLVNKETGKSELIAPENVIAARDSGKYHIPADMRVNVVAADGSKGTVPISKYDEFRQSSGGRLQSETEETEGQLQKRYGDYSLGAGLRDVADSATFGASTAVLKSAGVDPQEIRESRKRSPVLSGAAAVGGMLLPGGSAKLATMAGKGLAAGERGIVKLGAQGLGEGAVYGAQSAASELQVSAEPVNAERIISTVNSHVLYGAGAGLAGGLVAGGIGVGLQKSQKLIGKAKERLSRLGSKADDVAGLADDALNRTDDLAGMSPAELKSAKHTAKKAATKNRVEEFGQIYDDLKPWNDALAEEKIFVIGDHIDDVQAKNILRNSGTRMMKKLDHRTNWSLSPRSIMNDLRNQEAGYMRILDKADDIRAEMQAAGRTEGFRLGKLKATEDAIVTNREFQHRIETLFDTPNTSARMDAIEELAAVGAAPKRGGLLGLGIDVVTSFLPGSYIVQKHIAGAVESLVTGKLGPTAAKVAAQVSEKVGQAITVIEAGAAKAAPVLAKTTLAAASFGTRTGVDAAAVKAPTSSSSLFELYAAREGEIRDRTTMGPEGKIIMTPEARQDIAERLAAINESDPILADQMETAAARRMEFLAEKLPKRSDAPQFGGPDRERPSDFEMRKWARYVAAVENPTAIVDRVGDATITPEDAEALREVYPGMYADIQAQVMSQIPELQAALPYKKRLAMSILLGVPVDPAMDPRILAILQGNFEQEEGTEGGMQAPKPQPQFGSISKPEATAAQERAG